MLIRKREGELTDDAAKHATIKIFGRVGLDFPKGKLALCLRHNEEVRGKRGEGMKVVEAETELETDGEYNL